ncbi:undecaprenyl-diphosphatase [Microbacteriaceae bacterium SG_E_30_P1]|uniref:Undecaprenyl-diphosphatase n=1 Tax=Antiquaquibacter oligotrophicus TaxID=2880260 RepID=A0ABT6KLJ0_9MICO|nr:undecaprenyl-diphosphate phosphatase [Antiquaquibacter oligotrophicus]MDH6180871.1 undecaprenyl-diphosphatase [Antiquaquibacter oligotrophicus]UDF13418.1 undecaprenyl-diphosphate phosphatase [Antiquaquibacter oligotrophicus]
MGFIEAIILGLIQGLTEFLPISSSAHLRIAGEFLPSATDPGATFTAITQLGTELAVVIYFRKDIARILTKWFQQFGRSKGAHSVPIDRKDPDVRLGWLIIIGTVPIVILGYFAQDYIRSTFRSLWLVAIVLIVFGIILGLADLLSKRVRELDQMSYRDGILIGIAQMLALIPGVSRSGSTMTAGRLLGYTRPAAARFGFLLAVPAVFGSGLYELVHSFGEPEGAYGYAETALATVVAFGVGYAVIAFLMQYISKHSFLPFVIYRILLGGTLLVLLGIGVLDPL